VLELVLEQALELVLELVPAQALEQVPVLVLERHRQQLNRSSMLPPEPKLISVSFSFSPP
jgi:hypothetical protein